jgi:hypothetical protein
MRKMLVILNSLMANRTCFEVREVREVREVWYLDGENKLRNIGFFGCFLTQ